MTRPTDFGAQCEHGRLARSCERCDDAETIADLRDRLRIMAPMVCEGCGCAAHYIRERCWDCHYVQWIECYESREPARVVGACISVGLRALCGRRILEGC